MPTIQKITELYTHTHTSKKSTTTYPLQKIQKYTPLDLLTDNL